MRQDPDFTIGHGKGRLPRARSYLVDVKVAGEHALTWNGDADSPAQAARLASRALKLSLAAIAVGSGGAAPKVAGTLQIEVTPYEWRADSIHWNLSGAMIRLARGEIRSREKPARTGAMATALAEAGLARLRALTPQSELRLSIWGPSDDDSVTVMAKGEKTAPVETGMIRDEAEDALIVGFWHAARRKAKSNVALNAITPVPLAASASARAAIESGLASSLPEQIERGRAIVKAVREAA